MQSDGGDPASLYRKPVTPELAATLASMAEKAGAPKKAKKTTPRPRKRKPRARAHNGHVIAWYEHRRQTFIAEFMARHPAAPAG